MSNIEIAAKKFPTPFRNCNGRKIQRITAKQCIKFAMVVGNSHFSRAFGRTTTALTLASYRAMAIRCTLDFRPAALQVRPEYVQLESTEKVNLSYWVGMTFTAFAAARLLNIPRLTHASRQNGLRRANPKSRSLADLIGQDQQNRWHVLEAKGRQTRPSPAHVQAWKEQACTVASINGVNVSTRSYCVGLLSTPCSIELVDPPASPRNPVDLRMKNDDFGTDYYKPFVDFLRPERLAVTRNGRTAFVRPITYDPIDNVFVYIGLEQQHFHASKESQKFPFSVKEFEDDSLYIATDGVAVATSSGPCNLQRSPLKTNFRPLLRKVDID